ncbi:MAG: aminotransferase class IV [Actinobacteria bacterium]|nr:aminotransferase class IV [Actinomycetota bacterium]MCL5069499.1 aminotransferase class IV [Actinomycetota bacterium]
MFDYIFINSKFRSGSSARISIEDVGFLYGDGIFETIRCYKGKPFKLEEHIGRLFSSLRQLKYSPNFDKTYIKSAVYKLLSKNGLSQNDAYVKIIITRNRYGNRFHYDLQIRPNLIIIAKKLDPYPDDYYKNGIKITASDLKRNAIGNGLYKFKLLNYFENIYARNEAYGKQSFEGIFLTRDRLVLEGSMSNIFYIKNSTVFTPPITQNILPGITRQVVINICRENNIKISERRIHYFDIIKADEIFLTNSIMEIMPVKEIDIHKVEEKIPGSVTNRLMELYKKEIENSL